MAVIICNIKLVPHAAWVIVKEAFRPESIYGGMFVAMIMGLRRSFNLTKQVLVQLLSYMQQ